MERETGEPVLWSTNHIRLVFGGRSIATNYNHGNTTELHIIY